MVKPHKITVAWTCPIDSKKFRLKVYVLDNENTHIIKHIKKCLTEKNKRSKKIRKEREI